MESVREGREEIMTDLTLKSSLLYQPEGSKLKIFKATGLNNLDQRALKKLSLIHGCGT